MSNIMILGATSAIAQHVARLYATRGDQLFLVARDKAKLKAIADDATSRGAAAVYTYAIDLSDNTRHTSLFQRADQDMGHLDILLIAYGTLGDQKACEMSVTTSLAELQTNCLSVISILTLAANFFEQHQQGTIAAISSVAGDRGRQSNYVYGTAKGALTIFLQGLRNRLSKAGVTVLTIKPGFVDTPMTQDFKKGLLWVKPEVIARGIVKAIDRRKDVAYLPFFWRYIMLVIRHIPEFIFKKLSL